MVLYKRTILTVLCIKLFCLAQQLGVRTLKTVNVCLLISSNFFYQKCTLIFHWFMENFIFKLNKCFIRHQLFSVIKEMRDSSFLFLVSTGFHSLNRCILHEKFFNLTVSNVKVQLQREYKVYQKPAIWRCLCFVHRRWFLWFACLQSENVVDKKAEFT